MFHVIRQKDLPPSPNRTIEFQGEAHGAGISFLLVDNDDIDAVHRCKCKHFLWWKGFDSLASDSCVGVVQCCSTSRSAVSINPTNLSQLQRPRFQAV